MRIASPPCVVAIARLMACCMAALLLALLPVRVAAAPFSYFYDHAGRLVGVTDESGTTAAYRYDAVGNITSIARFAPNAPAVIGFSPASGAVGRTVTLAGSGFSPTANQNTVRFNQTVATVLSATSTRLVTSVPAGASTGLISVTGPAGSAASHSPFVVTAVHAPIISGFSPTIGPPGTAITISGQHFDPTVFNNNVTLNGRTAGVSGATAASLVAQVPPQASSGKLALHTPAGMALSTADFFVPPEFYEAADIGFTARLALGQSATVAIAVAGKKGMLLFDGVAGQKVSLAATAVTLGNTAISLIAPDGSTIAASLSSNNGGVLEPVLLPVAGTYTIFVNPHSSRTGSITLALNAIVDVKAAISISGPAVTLATTVAGQNGVLSFGGSAGQRVSMSVTAISSTLSCTLFSIAAPDGINLRAPGSGCTGTYFFDTALLTQTGNYSVTFNPAAALMGSATFALHEVPPDATAVLVPGLPAVMLTTTVPGQNMRPTLSGAAGQRISVAVTGVSSAINCPSYAILKPDGSELVAPGSRCGSSFFFDTTTLPVSGTYTIVLNPQTTHSGSASFALHTVSSDAVVTSTLDAPAVTLGVSTPGQNAMLVFDAVAGQRISVKVTAIASSLSCPVFSLLKPDGTQLVAPSTRCSAIYFIEPAPMPLTGSYTLVMNPTGSAVGSASASVHEVPPDPVAETTLGAAPVQMTIVAPGQNAEVKVVLAAGQQFTVRLTASTLDCATTTVRKPDGTVQSSKHLCSTITTLGPQVAGVAGMYTIRIDPADHRIGKANIAVTTP